MKEEEDKETKHVVLYMRLTDNILSSWKTHGEMKVAADKIWKELAKFNLNLNSVFDTSVKGARFPGGSIRL